MRMLIPICPKASCAERSWREDQARNWLLQHANDWQTQALLKMSERTPAPEQDALFAQFIDWLNHCIGAQKCSDERPAEVSNGAYSLVSPLIIDGLIPAMTGNKPTIRLRCVQTPNPDVSNPLIKKRRSQPCQYPILPTVDNAKKLDIQPLSSLNAEARPKFPKRRSSTPRWRNGRYLITSSKKPILDLFETSVRALVPRSLTSGQNAVSLYWVWRQVGTRRLRLLENEIIRGRLPFYQINNSGQYWEDLGLDLEEVGICERNVKGGHHVRNQLF